MENIDRLVQLITDRLLEKLEDKSERRFAYFVGQTSTKQLVSDCGFELTDNIESADLVLVESLTVDALLRVANLSPSSVVESDLLKALLTGKKVLVASECFRLDTYKTTAPSLLYRNLLKQKETLERYGVCFYVQEQLLFLLCPDNQKSQDMGTKLRRNDIGMSCFSQKYPKKSHDSKVSEKRLLITEAKLKGLGLSEGDTFKLEKGMIVTALAKDYLNRHHIRFLE